MDIVERLKIAGVWALAGLAVSYPALLVARHVVGLDMDQVTGTAGVVAILAGVVGLIVGRYPSDIIHERPSDE